MHDMWRSLRRQVGPPAAGEPARFAAAGAGPCHLIAPDGEGAKARTSRRPGKPCRSPDLPPYREGTLDVVFSTGGGPCDARLSSGHRPSHHEQALGLVANG